MRTYVLEQVSLKKACHFDDDKKDKPTPMDVDALLAKIQEMKDGGEGEEEEGEGRNEYQEVAGPSLEDIEHELLALKGQKGGKGGKGEKGKGGFDGYCNHCGKYGHRLNQCWEKDKEMKENEAAKGGGKSGGWNQ